MATNLQEPCRETSQIERPVSITKSEPPKEDHRLATSLTTGKGLEKPQLQDPVDHQSPDSSEDTFEYATPQDRAFWHEFMVI